jgi:hypothetical protein
MYQNQILLDETVRILNKKKMPTVTVMVLELEIDNKVSNINVSKIKCRGTPKLHIHYDRYKCARCHAPISRCSYKDVQVEGKGGARPIMASKNPLNPDCRRRRRLDSSVTRPHRRQDLVEY